jgi:AcrR family transcriptional regulator
MESMPSATPPPSSSSSESTPDKLIDAAARLWAERGLDNVPTAEIVRAAGQRNASAVHYHFGNRDEILRALLARHVPTIAARRRELLAVARSTAEVRDAAAAVVRPITEFAQLGWRERAYLRIGSELTGALDRATPEIQQVMRDTVGYEAWDLFRARCPTVAPEVWRERQELCIVFVGRAAADRARRLDHSPDDDGDRFTENLIEMVIGAMTAPDPRG